MEISTATMILSSLAQETRLEIVRTLIEVGESGMRAGAIADKLGVPAATLSFHLAQLKMAGLVFARRDGRARIYAVEMDALSEVVRYMFENCCAGRAEDCLPKMDILAR